MIIRGSVGLFNVSLVHGSADNLLRNFRRKMFTILQQNVRFWNKHRKFWKYFRDLFSTCWVGSAILSDWRTVGSLGSKFICLIQNQDVEERKHFVGSNYKFIILYKRIFLISSRGATENFVCGFFLQLLGDIGHVLKNLLRFNLMRKYFR